MSVCFAMWYSGAYTVQTNTVPLDTGRRVPFVSAGSRAIDAILGVAGPIIVDGTCPVVHLLGCLLTWDSYSSNAVWPGDMGVAVSTSFISTNDLLPVKNALLTMFSTIGSDGALPKSGPPLSQKGSNMYYGWALIGSCNYYLDTANPPFLQDTWTGYTHWARLGGGGINAEGNAILYKVLTTASSLTSYLAEEMNDLNALTLSEACRFVVIVTLRSSTTLAPQDANSFAVLYNLTAEESWKERISEGLTKNSGEIGPEAPELPDTISPFIGSFEPISKPKCKSPGSFTSNLGVHAIYQYLGTEYAFGRCTVNNSLSYRPYRGYNYDPAYTSHAHGWSSGPTSALTNYVLGLRVDEPMRRVWTIHPHLFSNVDKDAAEGGSETPLGWFGVSWSVDEGRMMDVDDTDNPWYLVDGPFLACFRAAKARSRFPLKMDELCA
ncbi:glycoside hydrolase family 78 protein [Moniliophthora roreri MCA 2997]|uniref:Glycoside hydrolase family 78 protein n=1 Tax=Moniliophthora roreri (strain MCA 2997) TaxID=1381753 RepID=V2X0M1_MONRO|nr:glycoside hydrolase family 78 protein [Moniliophthora roreri MCA 2997]